MPGGLPLYQTATAVIGRPFGAPEADTATHWWTLENPAGHWFGLGSVARVVLDAPDGQVSAAIHVYAGDRPDRARAAFQRYLTSRLATQSVNYQHQVEHDPHRATAEGIEATGFALFDRPAKVGSDPQHSRPTGGGNRQGHWRGCQDTPHGRTHCLAD